MKKVNVEVNKIGYPMPVVIIGTEVNGRANFMTAAWVTNINLEPPMLAICLSKDHLTSKAIQENKVFSVNFPDRALAVKADYCGLKSGKEVDKSNIFKIFRLISLIHFFIFTWFNNFMNYDFSKN